MAVQPTVGMAAQPVNMSAKLWCPTAAALLCVHHIQYHPVPARIRSRPIFVYVPVLQVRCKLAAVLLAQNDYEGCHQQLVAGAQLQATEAEKQLLASVLQKLQIAWPHL